MMEKNISKTPFKYLHMNRKRKIEEWRLQFELSSLHW